MIRLIYFLTVLLSILLVPVVSFANLFQKYAKVIYIDQEEQVGAAYAHGKKLLEFPILTGDDETPTPPGTYLIKKKEAHYYSRKFQVPMPYSLFFDLKGMRAIHEGDLPDPGEEGDWATHGCIHVEEPYMKWLFNWAEPGQTLVVIHGRRVWDEEKKPAGAESGAGKEGAAPEPDSSYGYQPIPGFPSEPRNDYH